jgi:hypothetical protein
MVGEIDCSIPDAQPVIRAMNDTEYAIWQSDQLDITAQAKLKAEQVKANEVAATQKAALLARLGITADEAKLLLQ